VWLGAPSGHLSLERVRSACEISEVSFGQKRFTGMSCADRLRAQPRRVPSVRLHSPLAMFGGVLEASSPAKPISTSEEVPS